MTPAAEAGIRRLILALLTFGLVAVSFELWAIGHYEDSRQFIPLVVNGTALAAVVWNALRTTSASVAVLKIVMAVMIVAGLTGVMLHGLGNREFQLETDPSLGGFALFAKILHAKAPPALAPGVMAQLGLLGLIYTYRHPASRPADARDGAH